MVRHNNTDLMMGNDFGDKIAFTVGVSYCAGFLIGFARGFKGGMPKSFRMPKKLIMNNLFNSLGRQTSRFGNAFAGAGLMYYMAGVTLNFLFQDEMDNLTALQKNMICGGITGMIFKSTLGVVPTVVGGLLGVAILGSMTKIVEEGNQRGYVAFEMKY